MANITISLDDNDKKELAVFCNEVGLSMSALFNMFAKKVISNWEIPFTIGKPKYSHSLKQAIKEADKIASHPKKYKGYDSFKDLLKDVEN